MPTGGHLVRKMDAFVEPHVAWVGVEHYCGGSSAGGGVGKAVTGDDTP